MKRLRIFAVLLILLIGAPACNLPGGTVSPTYKVPPPQLTQTSTAPILPSTSPNATPTAATLAPAVPSLTADMLKNGTYTLPQLGKTVTLVNGKYDSPASAADVIHTALFDLIAFGDLNGDGVEDAAVLFSENSGGTGDFISVVAVLNQNGAPVQSADRYIDDRAVINGMTITDGRILLDAVIHGIQDPMCCPNLPVKETLRLQNNKIILTHFASGAADQVREIHITAPAPGAVVSGSISVSGTVTITPFEGTLAYGIYDLAGNMLTSGSFTVSDGEMGSPGAFTTSIDISTVPVGTTVRLEISDLSAADGSILAMDSVEMTVQ
jgi:hypothetical protein